MVGDTVFTYAGPLKVIPSHAKFCPDVVALNMLKAYYLLSYKGTDKKSIYDYPEGTTGTNSVTEPQLALPKTNVF